MKQRTVVVTNQKLLRAATATPRPYLLPIWLAWLLGRLQTPGLVISGPDGACEAPYAAWLQAKLAVYDAKVQQKMAKRLAFIDLRLPVLAQEITEQKGLTADDEVAERRIQARLARLEKEQQELLALSAKAAELAAARHAQVEAKIPPRIRAFVQGASHRQPLDQAAVTARLCAAPVRPA